MNRKLLFSFILTMLLAATQVFAQDRTISGRVTDESGQPVPGATVVVKGNTAINTVTGDNGRYTLVVPDGATIIVSFLGQQREEVVGNRTSIDVSLSNKQLQEVVVTGYKVENRDYSVGSVATVSSKTIEQVPFASLDQILQGQAPGLLITAGSGQPGTGNVNILIRGRNSINSNTTPLFIMDGVPIEANEYANLNPNDIESVSVLKDASATSLFGSRGANGVIVITTKQGKEGKTELTYRFQYGTTNRTRTNFQMMNTDQRLRFEEIMASQGVFRGDYGLAIQRFNNGEISRSELDAVRDELSQVNTDWNDVFFRQGRILSHEFAARGGNAKTNFFISGNYRSETGILKFTDFDRYTFRTNISHTASDNFRLGLNLTGTYSERNQINAEAAVNLNNPIVATSLALPYRRLRDPETGEFTGAYSASQSFNLFQQLEEVERQVFQTKAVGNAYLEYDLPFVKGLMLRTNWGADYRRNFDRLRITPRAVNQSGITGNQGLFSPLDAQIFQYVGTSTIQYNRTFNEKHTVSGIVGYEVVDRKFYNFNYTGFGLNPNLTGGAVPPVTNSAAFLPTVGGRTTRNTLVSTFFDASYNYDDKYNVSFGLRRDGSSRFGGNNKYATFWSIGASWNLHQEEFLQSIPAFSRLTLRASYGTQGNQSVVGDTFDANNFRYLAQIGTGTFAGGQTLIPTVPANPDYRWETTYATNIGIDFGILKNRITGSIDLYNNETRDLLIATPLSRTTGFASLQQNQGVMRNRGVEFAINAEVLRAGDFSWSLGGNVTFNDNKITSLGKENEFELGTSIVRVGLPFGTHYVIPYAGVDPANGRPLYIDREGNITPEFREGDMERPFGSFLAPRFGGFSSTFNYGNTKMGFLNLSVFFTWIQGNQIFDNMKFFQTNATTFGGDNQRVDMLNMWTTPGQITDIPAAPFARQFSSYDLEDGSFLRLRNLTLAYTLPTEVAQRARLSNVRAYIQAQNLFTLTKARTLDPEDSNNINQFDYPAPRMFTFGFDITF